MKFTDMARWGAYQLLQRQGIPVTPQQIGIKQVPNTAVNTNNFSGLLNATVQPPTLPILPSDPSDPTQQANYNQAMQNYQLQFQRYHQQVVQQLLLQIQQLQLRNTNTSSSTSTSPSIGSSFDLPDSSLI